MLVQFYPAAASVRPAYLESVPVPVPTLVHNNATTMFLASDHF